MRDERLAAAYASADVFVFPSLTDTFGLVLLEALASGLPVAVNPVVGPLDVIGDGGAGIFDANLGRAALAALSIPREFACARARLFSASAISLQYVDVTETQDFAVTSGSILPMCRVMKRAISDSARLQPEIPKAAECERSVPTTSCRSTAWRETTSTADDVPPREACATPMAGRPRLELGERADSVIVTMYTMGAFQAPRWPQCRGQAIARDFSLF
jgi:Glycosyl transferases group 1